MKVKNAMREYICIWREYGKYVYICTCIAFIAAYYYFFITEPLNSDWMTLGLLKYHGAYWYDQIGRWGRRYAEVLTLKIMNPLVSGAVCVICIGSISILLIDLWNIKENAIRFLIGPILAVSPAIVDSMQYMHDLLFYSAAMLFAVMSAYIIMKHYSRRGLLVSSALLVASLSIYQAYLGVYFIIIIYTIILRSLGDEKTALRQQVSLAIWGGMCSIIGCAIYYLVWKLTVFIRDTPQASYAGIDKIDEISSIDEIFKNIKQAYGLFGGYYKEKILHIGFLWGIITVVMIFCISWLLFINIRKGRIRDMIMPVILIIMAPMFANIMCIAARGYGMEGRTSFQCQVALPFVAGLLSITRNSLKNHNKYIRFISYGIFLLSEVGLLMTYGARAYSSVRTWDIGNRTVKYQVQSALNHALEDYRRDDDMPIVFLGFADASYAQEMNPLREYSYNTPYVFWTYKDEVLMGNWRRYIAYNFGIDIGEISDVDYEKLLESNEFQNMKEYPSKEAYAVINGYYVILMDSETVGY